MTKHYGKISTLMITAALCLGISACLRHTGEFAVDHVQKFWPDPPEKERIAFVGAISTAEDLNIHPGVIKRVLHYLGGISDVPIVSPYGIARDAEGRIYVVDTYLHQVHMFDASGNRHIVFPSDGTLLASPVGIAIDDSRGLIYITDSKEGVVKVYKDRGKVLLTEFGNGLFERPTGIAVNGKSSELLVVDTLQDRVLRFDLSSRALKGEFGSGGDGDGHFHYPTHISVTPAGDIIVSDSLNFRVQVFSPEGRYLSKIGGMGNSPGNFSRPKGVASDSDGNIYVVDALFDNIQMFDARGRLLMAFGEHGNGIGAFHLPTGIYIDGDDTIYVSDSSNQRIQVFRYLKEEVAR